MKQTIYIILLCLLSGLALQTEVIAAEPPQLFFSEYIEGSGHNKALEIYNAGTTAVNLSAYTIKKDVNGNGLFNDGFRLEGVLAPQSTFVVVNSEASSALISKSDMQTNNICMTFNGNDMLKLYHNGVAIDSIGSRGGSNFGKDVTLVNSRGLDQDIKGRWLKLPKNYAGQLGVHDITVQPKLIISEYQEGNGYNKSIEITNLGIANCDISNIVIQRDYNGDNDFLYSYTPEKSGVLEIDGTIVIRNSKATGNRDEFITTNCEVLNFNGNDQIRVLYRGIETDRLGSAEPGNFAKDKLLTRKSDVVQGLPGHRDYYGSEWIEQPDINSILTLGVHAEKAAIDFQPVMFSRDKNYIASYVPKTAIKSLNKDGADPSKVSVNVAYVDGLGLTIQKSSVAASVSGKDIVVPVEYDSLGREAKKYLPYVSSKGNGSIDREQFKSQKNFYLDSDLVQEVTNFPFSETRFDRSPLNRVTKQGAPGADWQPQDNDNDHTVKYGYGSNEAEEVYKFTVDLNNNKLICNEYYKESTLFISTVEDENNKGLTIEYKNRLGQVVLKRSILSGSEDADTYYVYDYYGLLRYVLSPKATKQINDAFTNSNPDIEISSTDSFIKDLCYYYSYDNSERVITKQLPGAEPVYMVYNKYNRLVLTQDGEQRKNNRWLYTKYDGFHRPVQTGMYNADTDISQQDMQSEVEANSNVFEVCNNGVYTNNSFPQNNTVLYTETIYDEYYPAKFTTLAFDSRYDIDSYSGSYNTLVKGLVTYTKVRVLDASENRSNDKWSVSVNYYDNKFRNIQTISRDTVPGGKIFTDITGSNYSFTGRVENTIYVHQLNGKDAIIVKQRNEYDHADRLLRTYQKLEGAITKSEILYASFEYDELGQMIKKRLNNKAIDTEYSYNIRGWLKELNNTKSDGSNLYSMNLHYNNTVAGVDTEAQYNGNISAISWNNSDKAEQRYGFIYDNLNRLTTADYAGTKTDAYNTAYSYDINGNILTLERSMVNITTSFIESMDNLTYRYNSGNQLTTVTDAGTTEGFKQGSGDYLYDANGNMTVDPNKGLSDIRYNNLNLPYSITKGANKINYIYDVTGRKLANKLSGKTKYYFGNFVYTDDKLEYMICSDGLLNINGSTTNYEFHLKDHLGNTRVAVNETNDITQESNYYPFGLTFAQSGSSTNKYLYNGKEKQEETEWLDYGARMYTPELGRWFNVDPLAEEYLSQSTYHFSGNNPLKYVDNNGKDYAIYFSEKKDDKGNVTYTATIKATYYVKTGDNDAKKSAEAATGFWNDMTGQYTYTVGKGDDAKTYDVEFNLNVVEVDNPENQTRIDNRPFDLEGETKLVPDRSSNAYLLTDGDNTSVKGTSGRGLIKIEKENMLNKTGAHEVGHSLGIDHSDGLMHEGINGSPFWTVYNWDIKDIFINRPRAKANQSLYGNVPESKRKRVRKKN
jgi:RHS repeat-associated protein